MKKILTLVLALVLACAAALAESEYTYFPENEACLGDWSCGDYFLVIQQSAEDENLFLCIVSRCVDDDTTENWVYDGCAYDPVSAGLSCEEIGVKTVYTFVGDDIAEEEVFSDGAAAFRPEDDGRMVWTDFKAAPGSNEIVFERVAETRPVPTAESFIEGYFQVIGAVEQGTAGASLKQAIAAAEAAGFAVRYEMWDTDLEALRANMMEGWERMSDAEREAFDANFSNIAQLIDICLNDWEAVHGTFDDAGMAGDMASVVYDPLNRLAWENLCACTLTIGNDGGLD